MVMKALLGLFLVLATVSMVHGQNTPELHASCATEGAGVDKLKSCLNHLNRDYSFVYNQFFETIKYNAELETKLQNTTEYHKAEVHVWQTKYAHLLAQQGGTSIQDQVANLTDRVTAVETKAATNESLIYIIQNMLRTVQTDIEDIFLKINSVR